MCESVNVCVCVPALMWAFVHVCVFVCVCLNVFVHPLMIMCLASCDDTKKNNNNQILFNGDDECGVQSLQVPVMRHPLGYWLTHPSNGKEEVLL